jgi:hypothetical protein
VTGDATGQRAALDHALLAEPTAPDVAWEAANFFLIEGDVDRALREFRVVIANEDSLRDAALNASWRARPDTDALLRDVVPDRPDTLLSFAALLMTRHETDGSIKVWERIAQSHQKVQRKNLYGYVQYLIEVRRPDAAMKVWTENADTLGLSAYLPTEDNLVVNGDFSLDLSKVPGSTMPGFSKSFPFIRGQRMISRHTTSLRILKVPVALRLSCETRTRVRPSTRATRLLMPISGNPPTPK